MNRLLSGVAILAIAFVSFGAGAQSNVTVEALAKDYIQATADLKIPRLQLGYLENLNGILDGSARAEQEAAFTSMQNALARIDYQSLGRESQYLYQHLNYRIKLQLTRLDLENRFREIVPGRVEATTGIYQQPLGKEWYIYFLNSWLSVPDSPEELVAFGEAEVEDALTQIRQVQQEAGYGDDSDAFFRRLDADEFIIRSEQEVVMSYQQRKTIVQQHLSELFSHVDVPQVGIEPFPQSDKDTVPGQLVLTPDPVFRFNFFEQRHNAQDLDFLYLHEVTPGHAFHLQYNRDFPNEPYALMPIGAYAAQSEGWGAYVEEMGEQLGLYQTPWLKMGRLKFDLVRSARVVLDVGINYYGWDNQRALDYWHAHIKGQDQIAQREIDRVRRWPGQAISYKVGAARYLELRRKAQDALGERFDIREFHHQVLAFGSVPLFLVERRVLEYIQSA